MASHRRDIPVEGSWRVVDGENDSFDTSIIASPSQDHDDADPLNAALIAAAFPSQGSSQGSGTQAFPQPPIRSSQDSIGDFTNNSQDSQNLLLDPFRPSIPRPHHVEYRTPDPEFRMPRVGGADLRSRKRQKDGYSGRESRRNGKRGRDYDDSDYEDSHRKSSRTTSFQDALGAMGGMVSWVFGVFFQALRFAKLPLTMLLAIYLVFLAVVFILGSASNSIQSAFAPVCAIPGISLLSLPICSPSDTTTTDTQPFSAAFCAVPGASYLPFCGPTNPSNTSVTSPSTTDTDTPLPLDDMVAIQAKFESVLRQSAESVTLPMQMRRSSRHVYNLRTLVEHSELDHRHELVHELEAYVDTTGYAASALTRFEHHVASTVDDIINTNRLTLQSIRGSLSAVSGGDDSDGPGLLAPIRRWWAYRQSELSILEMYMHHTALVSEKVVYLITEAEGVLNHLDRAQSHLRVVSSTAALNTLLLEQSQRRDSDSRTLLTSLLQALRLSATDPSSTRRAGQLALLAQLAGQISEAASQLEALIATLEGMQVDLEMLHGRLMAPGALEGGGLTGPADLVLQIEAIRAGVERLQTARDRITTDAVKRLRTAEVKGAGERLELESPY